MESKYLDQLPRELRDEIYDLVARNDTLIVEHTTATPNKILAKSSLLLVDKRCSAEYKDAIWRRRHRITSHRSDMQLPLQSQPLNTYGETLYWLSNPLKVWPTKATDLHLRLSLWQENLRTFPRQSIRIICKDIKRFRSLQRLTIEITSPTLLLRASCGSIPVLYAFRRDLERDFRRFRRDVEISMVHPGRFGLYWQPNSIAGGGQWTRWLSQNDQKDEEDEWARYLAENPYKDKGREQRDRRLFSFYGAPA